MIRELMHPAPTLATIFLHDTSEDYDVGYEEINAIFGSQVANSVKLVTKKFRGKKIPTDTYFAQIAECPIASVVKGLDRINNVQTMPGVFSFEKQINYLDEVKTYFLPMLKTARRNFPEQESVYLSMKQMLMSQIHLIELIHKAGLNQAP
jgi:(p)ppGpp synthase/HD superfamily hydrolase